MGLIDSRGLRRRRTKRKRGREEEAGKRRREVDEPKQQRGVRGGLGAKELRPRKRAGEGPEEEGGE